MAVLTGKTVQLSWPGNLGSPPDIDVVRWDAAARGGNNSSLTAVLRLEQNPAPVLTRATSAAAAVPAQVLRAAVLVKIAIITGLGVTIQRNVLLTGTVPRTVRLPAAQSVVITAAIVSGNTQNAGASFFGNPYPPANVGSGDPVSASVTCVVTDQDVDFLGQDAPVWNPSGKFFTTPANTPVAGPGNLLACQGSIVNMGGAAALYVWLLDAKDAYVSGFTVTAPGSGYTSTPAVTYAADAAGDDAGGAQFPTGAVVATLGGGGSITALQFVAGLSQNAYGPFGLGMLAAPLVTLTGGGGTLATATATVTVVRSSYVLPVIGPFFAPGPFSFADELKDACSFEGGLSYALSSDPFNFTLVSGAEARIDFKVAQ